MEISGSFIFLGLIFILAAYLLGSIPTAVWIGKLFHGVDVRDHGSGNAGTTNVMRVLGVRTGIPVLVIDILKGWLAVWIAHKQQFIDTESELFMLFSIVLGISSVIGHIFPVFAGFRGGKGVATIAGVCIALHPGATSITLVIFSLVLLTTKYVSLSSIVAGICFPVLIIVVFQSDFISLRYFSLLAAVLLILTHHSNIRRLLRGQELKAGFLSKK